MGRKIGLFLGSAGSNSGGPERYETELVRALAKLDQNNHYEIFSLFKEASKKIGVEADNFQYTTLWPAIRPVAMSASLPLALRRSRPDVLHATFVPPLFSPMDYAFTLVCSSMFEHPEFYPPLIRLRLHILMGHAVRKAKLVICISEHIKEVIMERFNVSEDRAAVVPLAASEAFHPIPKAECAEFVKTHYGIEGPYLLFSGRWEKRKNVARIVEAFHHFKQSTQAPHHLVMTGERTWASQEVDEVIQRNQMEDEIIDLGKSPVTELPWLYAGADALVYCSLWEGFGLPLVEGMRAGIPVITSNTSSMVEIGGDAVHFVDPYSIEEISDAMRQVTSDQELVASLRERGLVRGATYSWERTARETLALYERL